MSEEQEIQVKAKKKFYKRPVFWIVAVVLVIIFSAAGSGDKNTKTIATNDSAAKTSTTADASKRQDSSPKQSATAQTSPANSPTAKPAPTPAAPTVTVSQKNALQKAKDYLSYTAFSHDGLVDQLVYEQFSSADATYGADNVGADWNAQAAKKAKSYMDYSSFSRGSLIDQLKYDKFTPDQATYGANSVGL